MSMAWRVREAGGAARPMGGGLGRIANRIKAVARIVHVRLAATREQRRMRRQLAHLDDRLLRDIGVDRAAIGRDPGDLRGIADLLTLLADVPGRC